jgi:hypothetical protein
MADGPEPVGEHWPQSLLGEPTLLGRQSGGPSVERS